MTFLIHIRCVSLTACAVLACCAPAYAESGAKVGFNDSIRPILAKHCVACHGGVKRAAELSFIYRESALPALAPGAPDESLLLERVSEPDDAMRMPPQEHGPRLSAEEVALLRHWVEQGAEWEEPWSFVPPVRHSLPKVERQDWPSGPIDQFVLARLEQEGLEPNPEADRAEWLRRVSFDLTGLPPSDRELDRFLTDRSDDAYERVVDRLLASPAFGERWASVWLDLARYSDTRGYQKDPHRDIWPFRDWLIAALNAGTPYDELTIKLLAGDLLPDATNDDRLASAFHRNTQTNTEGGVDDEEFRLAAVLDRVNTTWQAWQGTTFGCAQCHSHPYDPIEQDEYYQFVAIFNSTRDADLLDDAPRLWVPINEADRPRAEKIDREASLLRRALHAPAAELAGDLQSWKEIAVDEAQSTGNTRLASRTVDGHQEIWAGGTITATSKFTLGGPAPTRRATALRIDSLPKNPEAARKIPEMGFAVTRLRAWVTRPGSEEQEEVFFRSVFASEAEPMFDPLDSLRDNNLGWSVGTRQFGPQHAVFVLDEPIELPDGSRITLELKQDQQTDGGVALVIDRGRYALSDDPRWTELINSAVHREAAERLAALEAERRKIPSTGVPVMQEVGECNRRLSHVFERGNWMDRGKVVSPGLPKAFPPAPTEGPIDRLAMARWIASPNNPLTARVQVNRVWAQMFGIGIVETLGDFGTSGELPSHPELLDDLAVRFQDELGWSTKRLVRELALSATYRQSASATREQLAADPRNRLLSRGPRGRLSAEMVRDQALLVSGKLNAALYGPPAMPFQPDGIWRSINSRARWTEAKGPERFRRAVYTYWKRTSGYPSMLAFDVTARDLCTTQRIPTNTPLQALVTMNDPAFVELAEGLADRMSIDGGETPAQQVRWAFRQATSQWPSVEQGGELDTLYADAVSVASGEPENKQAFARKLVATTVLNLDAAMTK